MFLPVRGLHLQTLPLGLVGIRPASAPVVVGDVCWRRLLGTGSAAPSETSSYSGRCEMMNRSASAILSSIRRYVVNIHVFYLTIHMNDMIYD